MFRGSNRVWGSGEDARDIRKRKIRYLRYMYGMSHAQAARKVDKEDAARLERERDCRRK